MSGIATVNDVEWTSVLMDTSMSTKQLVSGTKYLGVMWTSWLALLAASLSTVYEGNNKYNYVHRRLHAHMEQTNRQL